MVKYALAMCPRLLLVLLLTAASFAAEQPFVRVRWKGAELRITYKKKLMTYDYGDPQDLRELFLYTIDKVRTDYLAEKNNVIYMILDVEGPSRGPEGSNSYCGAGTEAAKIWFAFDAEGEVEEPKIALYDSCYKNLEADREDLTDTSGEYGTAIAKYDASLLGSQDHVIIESITLWFNPENPKQGFTRTESCTDWGSPNQATRAEAVRCPE